MKTFKPLLFLTSFVLIVGLACALGGGGDTPSQPAQPPTNPPQQQPPTQAPPPATEPPTPSEDLGGSSDLVTFVDQNNLLAFDLPGNWTYEHEDMGRDIYSDAVAYRDTFGSPDETAFIESLVLFADNTVNNSVSQAAALDILNTYYSSTGTNNGDIRISSDQIMQDGSERFEWKSRGGGYSGVTFFEVRGSDKKTWLMWTLWWSDSADQSVLDVIDGAISSYYVP